VRNNRTDDRPSSPDCAFQGSPARGSRVAAAGARQGPKSRGATDVGSRARPGDNQTITYISPPRPKKPPSARARRRDGRGRWPRIESASMIHGKLWICAFFRRRAGGPTAGFRSLRSKRRNVGLMAAPSGRPKARSPGRPCGWPGPSPRPAPEDTSTSGRGLPRPARVRAEDFKRV